MGWFMVQSGLIDVPHVSHYRLAAHLSLAFIIFGFCVWFALDLYPNRSKWQAGAPVLRKWLWAFFLLLSVQIIWGAFVAGLNAGYIYNTFPKMNEFWIPPQLWMMEPVIINLFENMVTVQFIHRLLATSWVDGNWIMGLRPSNRNLKTDKNVGCRHGDFIIRSILNRRLYAALRRTGMDGRSPSSRRDDLVRRCNWGDSSCR